MKSQSKSKKVEDALRVSKARARKVVLNQSVVNRLSQLRVKGLRQVTEVKAKLRVARELKRVDLRVENLTVQSRLRVKERMVRKLRVKRVMLSVKMKEVERRVEEAI